MQLPMAFLDAVAIEELPADLWVQVFDRVGWPPSLDRASLGPAAILEAFRADQPTADLLLALEAMHDLGTEPGRVAILTAMADRRVSPAWIGEDWSARELAVHLFLRQFEDAGLNDVYARALVQAHEDGKQRTYNEYVGAASRRVTSLTERTQRLRERVLAYCKENGLGNHVQVQGFEDDGIYVFMVVHSHLLRKPLAVLPGSDERTMIAFRPVHSDIVRYDAMTGRLRISARAAGLVDFLRVAFAYALFDDPVFFSNQPTCTLEPLYRGPEALDDHEVPGIGRVRLTECAWEFPDGDVHRLRSADCFTAMRARGLAFEHGDLFEARLKISIAGRNTRPITVTIRTPSRLKVSGGQRHVEVVHEYLDAIGVRTVTPIEGRSDLWDLHHGVHPLASWQAVFGARTDALVNAGALVRMRATAVSDPENTGAGLALEPHEIGPGEYYGVSRLEEVPSRSLSATDIEGLALAPEAFRSYLQRELALDGPVQRWTDGPILDLGKVTVGGHTIRLFYAIAIGGPDAVARLKALAAGADHALLIPYGRTIASGINEVAVEVPVPTRAVMVRSVVGACGLQHLVPAVHFAREGARLVIDTRNGQVWVDGIEIPDLKPDTNAYKLVLALAKKCPHAVSTAELAVQLGHAGRVSKDGTTVARQAKAEAKEKIVEALTRAGRALDEFHGNDPFSSPEKGTYRCALSAFVFDPVTQRLAGK